MTMLDDGITPARINAARQRLRQFAAFTEKEDPELLANEVVDVVATLRAAARVDVWLRRYVAALRLRRPQ